MRRKGTGAFLFAVLVASSGVLAEDPPDSQLNPVTGNVESVDISIAAGARVRHTTNLGGSSRIVELISSPGAVAPRLAIDSEGDSWATWWKNANGEVYYAFKDLASGVWSAEAMLSEPGKVSRNPEIAHGSSVAWVAWETVSSSTTAIEVTGITDDPEPIPVHTIRVTGFLGDPDVLVHAESGHVWVTWIDSTTDVGWSEYDAASEAWDLPQFESYLGTSTTTARSTIRNAVLGP